MHIYVYKMLSLSLSHLPPTFLASSRIVNRCHVTDDVISADAATTATDVEYILYCSFVSLLARSLALLFRFVLLRFESNIIRIK